jgi:hypothetical protein
MREAFIKPVFRAESLKQIDVINGILTEYQAAGYDLTLRQLYYQLVARGVIENSERSYKRTADLLNNARLAGLVDWDMITDRGRETIKAPSWDNPGQIVRAAARQFRLDPWVNQANYIEVMVEKQALEGVLIPVCNQWGVSFTANKGYSSSSTLYETGKRLTDQARAGKTLWVLYLGDHDPSGLDMTRDITERLNMFTSRGYVNIKRLALNMDQVQALNPPENPAKVTDSRYKDYENEFGAVSWELDAIEPNALANLVTEAIKRLMTDPGAWKAVINKQADMTAKLQSIADQLE